MTWVKICGITSLEDALVAVDAGADAVGFVFHEKSPRRVEVETARSIIAELPDCVEKVGVFVQQNAEEIRQIVDRARLSAVQLHGQKTSESLLKTPGSIKDVIGSNKMIRVLPGQNMEDEGLFFIGIAPERLPYAVLIDSGSGEIPGGTGKPFDWEKARRAVQGFSFSIPVIIAGGLTALNVKEALNIFQPFGVDVASGVEARPGKKDPEKVRAFVREVREADRKVS